MDLSFDGQQLTWNLHGRTLRFKASSGLTDSNDPKKAKYDHRYPEFQDKSGEAADDNGAGPVPEGTYSVVLNAGGWAEYIKDECRLKPSWRLERIPRGPKIGDCNGPWANWGWNRIRFEATAATNQAMLKRYPKMKTPRSGFYLHDSRKGYSHGCIEVESHFFDTLRPYLHSPGHKRILMLQVVYVAGRPTYGGSDHLVYPEPPMEAPAKF